MKKTVLIFLLILGMTVPPVSGATRARADQTAEATFAVT